MTTDPDTRCRHCDGALVKTTDGTGVEKCAECGAVFYSIRYWSLLGEVPDPPPIWFGVLICLALLGAIVATCVLFPWSCSP